VLDRPRVNTRHARGSLFAAICFVWTLLVQFLRSEIDPLGRSFSGARFPVDASAASPTSRPLKASSGSCTASPADGTPQHGAHNRLRYALEPPTLGLMSANRAKDVSQVSNLSTSVFRRVPKDTSAAVMHLHCVSIFLFACAAAAFSSQSISRAPSESRYMPSLDRVKFGGSLASAAAFSTCQRRRYS
jgi:hypothetical protein